MFYVDVDVYLNHIFFIPFESRVSFNLANQTFPTILFENYSILDFCVVSLKKLIHWGFRRCDIGESEEKCH